jgi:hypothetical protein
VPYAITGRGRTAVVASRGATTFIPVYERIQQQIVSSSVRDSRDCVAGGHSEGGDNLAGLGSKAVHRAECERRGRQFNPQGGIMLG